MASESRARSLVAESIVIVFSILLAFAIDAAWDSRREREEELRFLTAIDAEIALNLEQIEHARVFRRGKLAAARELLGLAETPVEELDGERVDSLISAITWIDGGRWQTDAVETLLAGGKLSVIEDPTLRQQLVRLPPMMAVLAKVETNDYQDYLGKFVPYLLREASFAQIINASTSIPPGLVPGLEPQEQGAFPYEVLPVGALRDHRGLLGKHEFLGLVALTFVDQDEVLVVLDGTERRLSEVQAAIRASLGDAAPAAAEQKP